MDVKSTRIGIGIIVLLTLLRRSGSAHWVSVMRVPLSVVDKKR